jgi:hypothetical protein
MAGGLNKRKIIQSAVFRELVNVSRMAFFQHNLVAGEGTEFGFSF